MDFITLGMDGVKRFGNSLSDDVGDVLYLAKKAYREDRTVVNAPK